MPRRLRWLVVLVPTAAVVAVAVVFDSALDVVFPFPLNTVAIGLAVFACSAAILYLAFRRIDSLTLALRSQNADLAARSARASALHQVSLAITALGDLDEILDAIVAHARDLLGADVALLVLAEGSRPPTLRAWHGPPGVVIVPASGSPPTGDPFAFVRPGSAASRLASPLQRGSTTIGTLAVASASGRAFSVDDVETLSSLAIQAAIAIENARLQESLREIAVVAERQRIAREMHDGLAQVLGYVNTKSQAAAELLVAGRVSDAQAQLDELAAAARSVYVDVRETILALRTPIPAGLGLVAAVEDLGRRFGEASKIAVSVEAPDPVAVDVLGLEAEAQVFRIVREALTNVRKHAAAGRVHIAFRTTGAGLVVTVTDDGRGMAAGSGSVNPGSPVAASGPRVPVIVGGRGSLGGAASSPAVAAGPQDRPARSARSAVTDWPRYGLDTMRERAAAIGGTVAWSAPPEGGTEGRIVVPIRATGSAG